MNNFKKTGVYNQIHEPYIYKYDKIDSEMITQWIKDFKQGMIDTVLMGDYKKEMKMNRVELEIKELRDSTEENYTLNKMVNTDGNEFFVEYTLYKDYNKYFGLTLEGDSIEVVNIMEEEFAEFLHQYRLSITYPQVQAVHDEYLEVDVNDLSGLTIEEYLEYVKQGIAPIQGVGSKLAKFSPMYDGDDIEDEIKIDGEYDMNKLGVDHGSDLDIDKPYVNNPSMWTETSTNTGKDYAKPWTETSINTNPDCIKPWGGCYPSGSGTISVGSGTISVAPETFYIDGTESKSDQEKLAESVKFIESLLAQEEQVETKDSPNTLKNTENKSGAELITKIISDIIKELFTEVTCSINITLKQD